MFSALYRDPQGFEVRLVHCDIFEVSADVMIFGRTNSIRKQIERMGANFEPVTNQDGTRQLAFPRRDLLVARSPCLPWGKALSIGYRTRPVSENSLHAEYLSFAIYLTITLQAMQNSDCDHIVIVPFGWREPRVLVYSMLAALIRPNLPFNQFPRRVTICAKSGLEEFTSVLDNDSEFREAINKWNLLVPVRPVRKPLFQKITETGAD